MVQPLQDASEIQSPKSYLYTRVIKTHLGEVAAELVSVLISYGRLNAKDIVSKSKLPLVAVKSGLVSLIQMGCVKYWKDQDSKNVTYTFSQDGVWLLINGGEIIEYLKYLYGPGGAEIAQNVLVNGHIKLDDYFNSIENEEIRIEKRILCCKIFNDGWLSVLRPVDFNPLQDVWDKLYAETMKSLPRNNTTSEIKRVAEAQERTKVKFQDLLDSRSRPEDLYVTESGVKTLNPSLQVRLNLSRYQKKLRTDSLVTLAKSRLGVLTAFVYEAGLRLIEKDSPDLSHPFLQISGLINDPEEDRFFRSSIENRLVDDRKIVFTVHDLAKHLPEYVDLQGSVATVEMTNALKRPAEDQDEAENRVKRVKTEVLDSFDALSDIGNGEAAPSPAFGDVMKVHPLLQHHLNLLTQGTSIQFLMETVPGSFTVPFIAISRTLKKFSFDTLVKVTLGPETFRVFRCLKLLRLGDEKIIAGLVLLPEKTVRTELYKLVENNMAEIQEVPRSIDRAASKTFYLFRHGEKHTYDALCNSLLYCMANTLTNVADLKQGHKILLEKCEREDVKGHEEELLLESELKTLKELQQGEVRNLASLKRVKSLYDVFCL